MPLFKRSGKKEAKEKKGFTTPKCTAIICAAGTSARMGQDKLMMAMRDVPVIVRTITEFQKSGYIDEIIIVTKGESIPFLGSLCRGGGFDKVTKIIVGGQTRMQSVMNGLREVSEDTELVAVHDGARPLVTQELIGMAVGLASVCGTAVPAVALKDTIKVVNSDRALETLDREKLRAVQTPQVFRREILSAALSNAEAVKASITDDAQAVELLGLPVFFCEGSEENIKITTPLDFTIAEAILDGREYP